MNTVVVKHLLCPTALIEVEAVATHAERHCFGAADIFLAGARAGRMGDVVCLTTQLSLAREAVLWLPQEIWWGKNAGQLRRLVGLGWRHVVKPVEFLTPAGLPRYCETRAVRQAFLGTHFPAATGIIMLRNQTDETIGCLIIHI